MEIAALKARIEALLSLAKAEGKDSVAVGNELLQGALTIMGSVYGTDSLQVSSLRNLAEELSSARTKESGSLHFRMGLLSSAVVGALENLKADLEAGLVGSLQKRIASEVLTDFIQLARAVLNEPGDGAKNVAAVLTASLFEDTIRRMGATFAGVIGRDDLQNVIDALKKIGILQSPQLGIAQSYLSFRNHALHAEWDKIDRASVNSALAFVEQLLIKHF